MGHDPEEFVEAAQHRSRVATLQHGELLPEREVFQYEMPTTAKRASKRSGPEKKQIEHGPELYQNRGRIRQKLLILRLVRVLANNRGRYVG